MYRLFYNPKVSGDILFGLLAPEKKTDRLVRAGDLVLLFSQEEWIGFNLFHASRVYPFPEGGIIFAPEEAMIKALNAVLVGAKASPLLAQEPSGYAVAKIAAMEEHPLDEKAHILTLDLLEKKLTTVSWYPELNVGDEVVVALDGCILADGSVFHSFVSRNIPNEASLMSARELHLGDAPGAYKVKDRVLGSDFFRGGK
jgi:tRNA-binding protein